MPWVTFHAKIPSDFISEKVSSNQSRMSFLPFLPAGHESWGLNKLVCFVWCMLLNVVDDVVVDDDDDAIACRESRPERMLLYSRP